MATPEEKLILLSNNLLDNATNTYTSMASMLDQITDHSSYLALMNEEISDLSSHIRDIIMRNIKDLQNDFINVDNIVSGISKSLPDKMSRDHLYYFISDYLAQKISNHYNFNKLASRIAVERLQHFSSSSFKQVVEWLYNNHDKHKRQCPLVSDELYRIVMANSELINAKINYDRDFDLDYFGIRTLERSYLMRIHNSSFVKPYKNEKDGLIVERPQHLFMRVALGIHCEDLDAAFETYDLMSKRMFTHATPTLFNFGTRREQGASCFLLGLDDSIEGIFNCVKNVARISKWSGGIGISLSSIRGNGSIIRGTNGKSSGIIPLCRLLNVEGMYVNQGGKRNGSIAIYLEPWHCDIWEFIELRRNTGAEEMRAKDLFLALWVPDIFMRRVLNDEMWSLMCPDECPNLYTTYGDEFERLYIKYESEKRFKKQIRAIDLWFHILENQIETGMPYMSYKDHVNNKSNQQNLGTIRSSNLCVAPETNILTSNGYQPIHSLVDQYICVWNGTQWSNVLVRQTGSDQKLITIKFSNGEKLTCTPYHRFKIHHDDIQECIVPANYLKPGMTLEQYNIPIIDSCDNVPYDNAYYYGYAFAKDHTSNVQIPVNLSLHDRLDWLSGYIDGCSYMICCDTFTTTQNTYDNILAIKRMINSISVTCMIKEYDESMYYILLTSRELSMMKHRGVTSKCMSGLQEDQTPATEVIKILEIIDDNRYDNTYCATEPLRNMLVFNGIPTMNCNEINEYSDGSEYAVCNLASLCLTQYINPDKTYNFEKLAYVAGVATRNLNKIIDKNFYPTDETKTTNMKNRPIGIGVQGLADVYNIMGYPFGSSQSKELNRRIFETIYYGCLTASCDLAKEFGPYNTFHGSPFSRGQLQYHMWGLKEKDLLMGFDWKGLVQRIKQYGTRNSLLTAMMPTASTAQIFASSECFEPYMSNIFVRSTLAGEYIVMNQNLMKDLEKLGLWDNEMRKRIIITNGSIQKIDTIPQEIREIYKTAFEIMQRDVIDQASDRGPFVDQSQSMNLFIASPDFDRLTSCHFHGWKRGLKTGMYYLRSLPAVDPIQFGIDVEDVNKYRINNIVPKTETDQVLQESVQPQSSKLKKFAAQIASNKQTTQGLEQESDSRSSNYQECTMCSG